jgi:hypothetical protein
MKAPIPFNFCFPVLLVVFLVACGDRPGTEPTPDNGDSTSVGTADGLEEVRTQDGGVMKGEMLNGKRHGPWTSYFANGTVRSRATYDEGVLEGSTEVFHNNGMTYYTGQYAKGKAVGEWLFYDAQGALVRTATHDSLGKLVEQH